MRKRCAAAFTAVIMVIGCALSGYAGILPNLQDAPAENAISLHMMLGETGPEPVMQEDGSYEFDYDTVTLSEYEDFGRVLAQEGYTLARSDETGNESVHAVVSDGTKQFTVIYDPNYRSMSVIYPEGVVVSQYNEANPYLVDRNQSSILPQIPQAVSLHQSTCKDYYDITHPEDGGTLYRYSGVSYEQYELFSTKLEEAGFTLESSQTLVDGTARAVVSNGEIALTVDYNVDSQEAEVLYPKGVFAKDCVKYDDYTLLQDGDEIQLMEDVSMKVIGWEEVESYVDHYLDNNWIPSKYVENNHISAYGEQMIFMTLEISYNRPDAKSITGLLNDLNVSYGVYNMIYPDRGEVTGDRSIYDDSDNEASGEKEFTFGIGFSLNEAQMEHLDKTAITFMNGDATERYVYYLSRESAS